MTGQLWWYTARAGGIVAWSLLVASVVWGLLISTRTRPAGTTPAWLLDLHRFLGGLAVVFIGVHVGALLLDSYVQFSLADVLVPFASSWHPMWVAWGIVAMYLALAVEITSLLRRHLPRRVWRRTHMLSLPLLALATVHFIVAGTDATSPFAIVGIAVSAFVVAGLVARRLAEVLAPELEGREPAVPVAASQPLTVPNRGETRWPPPTSDGEQRWSQPSPH